MKVGERAEPTTASVKDESIDETVRALADSLFFVGTGAAIASAAMLGGTLLSSVTFVAAVGAVTALMGLIIQQSDANIWSNKSMKRLALVRETVLRTDVDSAHRNLRRYRACTTAGFRTQFRE